MYYCAALIVLHCLYTRYCKSINDESDLSDLVVSEQLDLTQAELLKYVDIQQITTKSVSIRLPFVVMMAETLPFLSSNFAACWLL